MPRAGGEVARPRAPPPGPKDPLHRDAQRPASPPCPAAPPASLESFEIKPARLSTPPQGSTVLCLANRPLCRQATRLSPAPGCTRSFPTRKGGSSASANCGFHLLPAELKFSLSSARVHTSRTVTARKGWLLPTSFFPSPSNGTKLREHRPWTLLTGALLTCNLCR
uniref:Uncharacterized protein n=1 Tax=Mus musculus TaxID=10090 RepID=Q8CF22_MOUSE|nr:unnamed protein product [Mus musculus]